MKNIKLEIKWALVFVLTSLLWMLMERLTGLHSEHLDKHATYTVLFAIPAVVIYVFALLDKRRNFYHGTMTYKQGLVSGLIITLAVAIMSPLSQYIISTFISPDYFRNAIAYATEQGKMSQEEAEQYFSLSNYTVQALVGALSMGVLTSAVVAIFTRKKGSAV